MKRLLVVWLVAIVTGAWAQEGARIESFGRMKMAADSQEMTDGIGDIPNSRDTKDNIYDLNGRKIQDRNHKGIFISDSKKSLRK